MEGINSSEDENVATRNNDDLNNEEETEILSDNESQTEESRSGETHDTHDGTLSILQEQEHWSGSGIWERTENKRWIAVRNHRIPSRSRTVSESNLVLDMGTGQFVQNFDSIPSQNSEADQEFRIVASTQSIIRLTVPDVRAEAVASTSAASTSAPSFSGSSSSSRLLVDSVSAPLEDLGEPVAGPSGRNHSHNLSGHQPDIRGHPSNLARTSEDGGRERGEGSSHSSRLNSYLRRKLRRKRTRKKKRNQRKKLLNESARFASYSAPRQKISLSRSVDSSPGRDTPSPSSLAKICLYWEQRLASPEYVILSDSESEP